METSRSATGRRPSTRSAERRVDARLTAGLALSLVASVAAGVGLVVGGGPFPPTSADLVGLGIAAASICLAALTIRRDPVIAWPALVLAGVAATGVPVRAGTERVISGGVSPAVEAWLPLALLVALAAGSTTIVAALYATRPERRPGRRSRMIAWALVGWTLAAAVAAIVLRAAGLRSDPALTPFDVALAPVSGWLIIVLGLSTIGLAADGRPALARTRARVAAGDVPPGPVAYAAVVIDELLGRSEGRRVAAEAERRRLAGDLHADVMPTLRHAMAALESGRPATEVAADLRAVADELEGVVAERRDPVLELLGLVRAIEVLAERSEARGGPPIEILVVDEAVRPGDAPGPDRGAGTDRSGPWLVAGRPPQAVEAAALRVTTLALDNVIRHAAASRVRIACRVTGSHLALHVEDDGRGLGVAPEAVVVAGRHGLADMQRVAVEVGARVRVGPGPGGGTLVSFDWPT